MSKNIEDILHNRRIRKEILSRPEFRRLQYWTYGVAAVGFALMFVITIWMDKIPWRMMIILRGCAGLFFLAFIILAVILKYRTNVEFLRHRR